MIIICGILMIISVCICIVLGGANIGKCDMFDEIDKNLDMEVENYGIMDKKSK